MSHIPGPWAAASRQGDDWDSVVYVPGTPNEICQCFHERGNEDECEANARLIAAAPELLDALQLALGSLTLCYFGREADQVKRDAIKDARAAIAKATGVTMTEPLSPSPEIRYLLRNWHHVWCLSVTRMWGPCTCWERKEQLIAELAGGRND